MFEDRFMPRMQRFMSKSLAKKLSPAFIWSEIMSIIKGGIEEEYQNFLSNRMYRKWGSKWLSEKEKNTIYYIFLQYEQWKLNLHAFDFLDVVSHVLKQVQRQGILLTKKDDFDTNFLIIDEVQDLYPKTIRLLLRASQAKVIFAGDTAQTIAKGVNSRIQDIRTKLQNSENLETMSINLSVNYRSQNSILQLANNVVKVIETIFPDSIDKLNEEISDKTGDKPCLIEPCEPELLCEFFFGKTIEETNLDAN